MKRKFKILFAASEASPFIKTGGLGDVAGSLPQALNEIGCDCRVILPKYVQIKEEYKQKMTPICSFYVPLSWRNEYCGIEKLTHKGVTYYFVDNEHYFKRDKVYGEFDDGERFAFFSKAVTEVLSYLENFKCDIIHCNDWHTALVPVFLREFYQNKSYENIKTVLTVHNLKFQGQMSDFVLGDILGLYNIEAARNQLKGPDNSVNFMQGGLCYTDFITTVSPSYAEEIKTKFYGENLDWLFIKRSERLKGILNGIDVNEYKETISKEKAKENLQKELSLKTDKNIPIISIISRLTEQKGLDLIENVISEICSLPIQFVILGTGDKKYEEMFSSLQNHYQDKVRAILKFDEGFSKRLYAGSDIFLMPSKFEPCGLSQMIAMRYGTLPIVRETGGLKDTVDWSKGFSFLTYNAHDMLFTIQKAVDTFINDKESWNKKVNNAKVADFSWSKAAKEYLEIYENLSRQ